MKDQVTLRRVARIDGGDSLSDTFPLPRRLLWSPPEENILPYDRIGFRLEEAAQCSSSDNPETGSSPRSALVKQQKGRSENTLSQWLLPVFILPLALGLWICGISSAEELLYEPDVVLVMKDKVFHVLKGVQSDNPPTNPAFSLPVGRDLIVLLRNEDNVAHEFVSPLLLKVEDLQFSGRATLVYTLTAVGVRVEPRDSVLLRFDIPDAGFDQFHFWCNIHGKLLDDTMRGEIFILNAQPSSQ